MEIPVWVKKTKFQCDVTKEEVAYDQLLVMWYDKHEKLEGITTELSERFVLVKQGDGSKLLRTHDEGWSLNYRKLTKVFEDNLVVFFTGFLVVDSLHDKGTFRKVADLNSWNQVFWRLMVPHYEKARHRIKEARQLDDFQEFTESQLLSPKVLPEFVKMLYGSDQM